MSDHGVQIDERELVRVCGGMKWEDRQQSLNVEDRRPGAPPLDQQRRNTEAENFGKTYKDNWRPNQGFGR